MSKVDASAMLRYERARDDLVAALADIEPLLEDDRRATVADIRVRLERGKFVLAVVGEFSSGKSFLLNVLLERFRYERTVHDREIVGLLATDINPSTATITELTYGRSDEATAFYDGGRTERIPLDTLNRFIAVGQTDAGTLHEATADERGAPVRVAVQADSPFLQRGFVVADTPGLASVNPAHRRATLQFLPTADAVLYLIDTQQPFSEGDASFLGIVRKHIDSIFIVQTKIDLWRQPQSDGRAAWEHAYERIERLAAVHAPGTYVYALSAREYAQGVLDDDPSAMEKSRFPRFLTALDALLIVRTGRARLRRAQQRTVAAANDESDRIARDIEMLGLDAQELASRRGVAIATLATLDDQTRALRESLLADGLQQRREIDRRSAGLADDLQRALAQAFDTADVARLRDRERLHLIVDRTVAGVTGEFAAAASESAIDNLSAVSQRIGGLLTLRWNLNDAAAEAFGAQAGSSLWSGDVRAAIAATIVLEAIGGPAIEIVTDVAARFATAPPGSYMKRELAADLRADIFPRLHADVTAFGTGVGARLQQLYGDLAQAALRALLTARDAGLGSIDRAMRAHADGDLQPRLAQLQDRRARIEAAVSRSAHAIGPFLAHEEEIAPADPGSAIVRGAHAEAAFDAASYDLGLRPERWRVAVLGALRRGKSSLINAIAGQNVLNDDLAGSVRFPIHVRYGERQRAYALEEHGQWREIPFKNLASAAADSAVLALVPWNMPRELVLVHAPAFDSGDAHAEDVNVVVASHASEVLCLFSRQLSDRELELYERVAEFGKPLLFAHTIADNEASRERRHVVELAKTYLHERNIASQRVFVVSAHEYDAARAANRPPAGWNELAALRSTLESHAESHMARLERRTQLSHAQRSADAASTPKPSAKVGLLDRLFARGAERGRVER